MIVSWDWLKHHVELDMSAEALGERLMMAGFNLESIGEVEGDIAIDLEITSNRPDCLGHRGVAREIATLYRRELKPLPIDYPTAGAPVAEATSVVIESAFCPRYVARLIEGVKIGPSPRWLKRRLTTLGLKSINNVVDVTNYVMLEMGQPLHAFDFAKLRGGRIVVRDAQPGEKFLALDGKEYPLDASHGVIADAERPVALAGVMGGSETGIVDGTTTVLLESAEFEPIPVRRTSRALELSSDSSYRFERRIDPAGLDFASERACHLITRLAGGTVRPGRVFAGTAAPAPKPVRLRVTRARKLLSLEIDQTEAVDTLTRLECAVQTIEPDLLEVTPPTFRRDLTREVDLIEEVGRIHGYADVDENRRVPLAVAPRGPAERVLAKTRAAFVGFGYCQTITFSMVDKALAALFRHWSEFLAAPLVHTQWSSQALRPSLLPSLAEAVRRNETRSNEGVRLFEIAHIFAPTATGIDEPTALGLAALADGADKGLVGLRRMRGELDAWAERLGHVLELEPALVPGLDAGRSARLLLAGKPVGVFGYLGAEARAALELRQSVVVAEILLADIVAGATLVPRLVPPPSLPTITRDLAFILEERVLWADLQAAVRANAGPLLESLAFVDLYRGKPLPEGRKSIALRLVFRRHDQTLTHDEVNVFQGAVVSAVTERLGGQLRAG